MRYGKVYFYDRMGNREPSDAEKIRDALDNFDAPRFRPPNEPRLQKNYTTSGFSPLESPPPPMVGSPVATTRMLRDGSSPDIPANIRAFGETDPMTPPQFNGASTGAISNIDRYKMNLPADVYPEDPMPRMVSTPPVNNVKFNLGTQIQPDIENGIASGFGSSSKEAYQDTTEPIESITQSLGNIRVSNDEEKLLKTSSNDYYGVEICAQCQAEDAYMARMRQEAEEERRKYEDSMRRAHDYSETMRQREEEFRREEDERRRALLEHVDRVNAEIIELKKRRPKTPVVEYNLFRHESPRLREAEIRDRKAAYRAELDVQIEEKRRRQIAEFEKNEALDVTSNAMAALEFANAREAERQAQEHAKEIARKQLEFQMEMAKIGPPADKNFLWWAERPDEHGWREARLRGMKHTNQVERNQTIKQSIAMLEEYKERQQNDDYMMRETRRAKYAKIRDQIHENAKMMAPETTKSENRPLIVQPDPRVEEAWKEAHEKYDKKFRALQDNTVRSISGAALEGASSSHHSTSCRRCARCSRPLERKSTFVVSRGETIMPNKLSFHRI